jgi:hypothetical protein
MTSDPAEALGNDPIIASLTSEEKGALTVRNAVITGDDVVWIEPDGRVRRDKISNLYYIRTPRGVYRVSRIGRKLVEV